MSIVRLDQAAPAVRREMTPDTYDTETLVPAAGHSRVQLIVAIAIAGVTCRSNSMDGYFSFLGSRRGIDRRV